MPTQDYFTCALPTQTCYPRYHNTKRRLKNLQQRFEDDSASISSSDDADLPKPVGDVHFIILSKRPTTSNYISKALFPKEDMKNEVVTGSSLQRVLTKLQTEAIVFVPSRMSERLSSTIRKNRDVQFIIVSNNTKMKNQIDLIFQDYSNVKVSLTEDVKDTAIVALEKLIFEPMKQTTKTLVKLLKSNERYNAHEDTKTKRTTPRRHICTCKNRKCIARKRLSQTTKKISITLFFPCIRHMGFILYPKTKMCSTYRTCIRTCKYRKCFGRKCLSQKLGTTTKIGMKKKNRALGKRRKEMSDWLCCVQAIPKEYMTRSKRQDYVVKEQKEKIQMHRNSMELLLGEILGMFDRSKLPENERPRISKTLERNIAEELFAIDASVKSCGYRFETLQVFVDDIYNGKIQNKVIEVLRKNNIKSYDIVPSIGSFKPLHKVGAKVHPNSDPKRYGTVSGFVKKNEDDLAALMSRHVAMHSPDGNVFLRDKHIQIQATIIPQTLPPQKPKDKILDISAAEIQTNDKEKCDTRFKTEAGELTTGKQSSYETRQLRGREVHIWGGTTSPGLGIITMPEIRDRDEDNTYIIVESRQNTNATFSQEGDSGSAVCADDIDGEGVEVVSMLIGEDYDNPGKYATFRIDKGLEQLKRQTKDDFHLCLD